MTCSIAVERDDDRPAGGRVELLPQRREPLAVGSGRGAVAVAQAQRLRSRRAGRRSRPPRSAARWGGRPARGPARAGSRRPRAGSLALRAAPRPRSTARGHPRAPARPRTRPRRRRPPRRRQRVRRPEFESGGGGGRATARPRRRSQAPRAPRPWSRTRPVWGAIRSVGEEPDRDRVGEPPGAPGWDRLRVVIMKKRKTRISGEKTRSARSTNR